MQYELTIRDWQAHKQALLDEGYTMGWPKSDTALVDGQAEDKALIEQYSCTGCDEQLAYVAMSQDAGQGDYHLKSIAVCYRCNRAEEF